MGSPCELLCEASTAGDAKDLTELVAAEAWRIEEKLSRYIDGNIIHQINSAAGKPVTVDAETAQLLDFAQSLYEMSDAAFDITSGVLRRAWTFDGSDNVPSKSDVKALLGLVGWDKADWRSPILILPVTGPPQMRKAWTVGIEPVDNSVKLVELRHGALATSGDARRFLIKDGTRYGHVIDPRTGWPVEEAASSVTVAADTCTQAGMLSTLAMLKGPSAEQFLDSQTEQYWCSRGALD